MDDARKTEAAGLHNFQMLEQLLLDETKFGNKKENGESKEFVKGDLDVTPKELRPDVTAFEGLSKARLAGCSIYAVGLSSKFRHRCGPFCQSERTHTSHDG